MYTTNEIVENLAMHDEKLLCNSKLKNIRYETFFLKMLLKKTGNSGTENPCLDAISYRILRVTSLEQLSVAEFSGE